MNDTCNDEINNDNFLVDKERGVVGGRSESLRVPKMRRCDADCKRLPLDCRVTPEVV